jgi:Methyltransferase domain
MLDVLPGRAGTQCFCCRSMDLTREWAAISPFFAKRAMALPPQAVALIKCNACGTRYFDFSPTQAQLGRLYAGYRGEAYFRERNFFEPWYTKSVNDDLGAEEHMRRRRALLADTLKASGIANDFAAVLDHGGDRGQLLQDLNAPVKAVFDISGVTPDPGVTAIDQAGLAATPWDLILCCHVLEHLPDPQAHVAALAALGQARTAYYFEVPDEAFTSFGGHSSGWQKRWIGWLTRHPSPFKLFDLLSVVSRLKLRLLPPLCFVALREHLSFYSVAGLSALLRANGFDIRSASRLATGAIGIVAVKSAPVSSFKGKATPAV